MDGDHDKEKVQPLHSMPSQQQEEVGAGASLGEMLSQNGAAGGEVPLWGSPSSHRNRVIDLRRSNNKYI